jgi:hypothetical protein
MVGLISNLQLASITTQHKRPQCQIFKNEKNKVCHPVRESFTDQFSHNTGKSLIRRVDKSKSNVLWNSKLLIGIYGGYFWQTWFLGVGCTSRAHTQYKARASKRLGATNKESNNGHNHAKRQSNIKRSIRWHKKSKTK